MNTPTAALQSPRKRPRPKSIVRNPYAKHTPNQNRAKHESPKAFTPESPADNKENNEQSALAEGEQDLAQELDFAIEFGGITEGIQDLSINDIELGDDLQQAAIRLASEGQNIFLTGKAGTGKSWTIRRMVATNQGKNIQLTAPTGIAAINIGGTTIHAWGGFHLGQYYWDYDMMFSKMIREKIVKTNILLIDEISMVDGHMFDILECMVAIIRNYKRVKDRLGNIRKINQDLYNEKDRTMSPHLLRMRWCTGGNGLGDLEPWGGLQVILVGDFYQLPPVPNGSALVEINDETSEEEEPSEYVLEIGRQGSYAFESCAWQKSNLHTIELQEIHRQQSSEGDGLIELLNSMREGTIDPIRHHDALVALEAPLPPSKYGIVPTELHALNRDVYRINACNLDKLDGKLVEFNALDEVILCHKYKHKLLKKHKLLEYSSMPYLYASVEEPPTPPQLQEAREKLDALGTKKEELKAKDDFEALISMRPELTDCKDKVDALEREYREKAVVDLASITKYLEGLPDEFNCNSNNVLERFQKFDKQLQQDYEVLQEHACLRYFNKDCRVRSMIHLKVDSQVMLLWNLDVKRKLANGSRGVITEFVSISTYNRLLKEELAKGRGNETKTENIVPEEGRTDGDEMTVEEETIEDETAEVTGGKAKVKSPVYSDLDPTTLEELRTHLKWLAYECKLQDEQRSIEKAISAGMKVLPYVQFTCGRKRLILPKPFQKGFKDYGVASRWQLPLCLAWAISIHKSQGMTIDWLHVNLRGCFENGQAYVACSRGRSLNSMEVENFNVHEIKTSDNVKAFYKSLRETSKPYTKTWVDHLEAFDAQRTRKKELVKKYKNKRCDRCNALCNVQQVKKKNFNEGRFFVACSNGHYGDRNHHFEWIPVKPEPSPHLFLRLR